MQYKICVFDNMPEMDELPVGKIVYFPDSNDINNNIYAQARICYVTDIGLIVRIWVFESKPFSVSGQVTLDLKGEKGDITVAFSYSKIVQCFANGKTIAPCPQVSFFESEDLQGEYWGGQFVLDNEFLNRFLCENVPLKIGDFFIGNITTFVKTKGSLFDLENGKFILVS